MKAKLFLAVFVAFFVGFGSAMFCHKQPLDGAIGMVHVTIAPPEITHPPQHCVQVPDNTKESFVRVAAQFNRQLPIATTDQASWADSVKW
jgi:hypothetical protein